MGLHKFLDYLSIEKRASALTCRSYQTDLEQFQLFLNEYAGVNSLKKVRKTHVRSWMGQLMEDEMEASSVSRKLSALQSFYKFLLRNGEVSENPLTGLKAPRQKKRLPSFVEQEKISSWLDNAWEKGEHDPASLLIFDLMYSTGIRRAELIGLTIGRVDLSRKEIKVLGKRNKERIIPLTPALTHRLNHYLTTIRTEGFSDAPLFVTPKGKPLYPTFVYRLIRGLLFSISVQKKRSPHVLRHSFATHMLNNGADLNAVKELLGHSSLAATQVYTHTTFEKLKSIYQTAHPRA